MADCPLADECPSYSERIEGMGCAHFGDKGGKDWCNHYGQPIEDLKTQPVKPGEEVVVEVGDIHESGAGVGRTEEGFIVLVDGVLPEARARVKVTKVNPNYAWGDELERLPMDEEDDEDDEDDDADGQEAEDAEEAEPATPPGDDETDSRAEDEALGSREDFWGG